MKGKLFLLPLIFLLIIPVAIAQESQLLPLVGRIFGEMPNVCTEYSTECLGCMITTKFFPFIFFATIFFLILLLVISPMTRVSRTSEADKRRETLQELFGTRDIKIPTQFIKIAAILAIILSLLTLNFVGLQALDYMRWWIGILIFIFLLFLMKSLHVSGIALVFAAILLIVITIVTVGFLANLDLQQLYSHCF